MVFFSKESLVISRGLCLHLFEKVNLIKIQWKQLWLLWPLIGITLLNIDTDVKFNALKSSTIILYVLVYCSTGFFEEILCRGFMLNLFLNKWGDTQRGIYGSTLLSSVLFGSFHLICHHSDFLQDITQVIIAFFIGMAFAACYLRIKSILPVVILHALFDIGGSLNELSPIGHATANSSLPAALLSIGITSILFTYSLFILRKAKIERQLEYTSNISNSTLVASKK